MKNLLKIAKLIPKLGTDNPHEKQSTLQFIEKLLAADGITWTDVGMQVTEFLTNVLGAVEEPAIEEKKPAPAPTGWNTTRPQPQAQPASASAPGSGSWGASTPPPRPTPPPPPPPPPPRPRIDPRCYGTNNSKLSLVEELIRKSLWQTQKEQQVLAALSVTLKMGIPPVAKQQRILEDISKRL